MTAGSGMKILEINTFDRVVGGVESYLAAMAVSLLKRGHEVVPLYLTEPHNGPGLVPTHRGYHLPDLSPHHLQQILGSFHSRRLAQVRRDLWQILATERPDVVHCNNVYSPIVIRELYGLIPVVRTVHDYRFMCPRLIKVTARRNEPCDRPLGLACLREGCVRPADHHGLRHLMLLRWEREVSKGYCRLIAKSRHMKRQLVQNGVAAERVEVIPLSVKLPQPAAGAPAREGRPTILYVGRIAQEKGVDLLLKVLSRLRVPFSAVIAGSGPQEQAVRALAADLGLKGHVRFEGWTEGQALQRLYQACYLVVVPSVWPEPFGLVGLEAMANARPVVAFDVGGIPEWLDHGRTGLLVPPGDEATLGRALEELLQDRERACALGAQGLAQVRSRFTMDLAAEKLVGLLQKVVGDFSQDPRNRDRTWREGPG